MSLTRPASALANRPVAETGHESIGELLQPLEVLRISAPVREDLAELALEIVHEPPEVLSGPPRHPPRIHRSQIRVLAPFDKRRLPAKLETPKVAVLLSAETDQEPEDSRDHRR